MTLHDSLRSDKEVETATQPPGRPEGEADRRSAGRVTPTLITTRFGVLIAWAILTAVFWAWLPGTFGTRANFENIFGSQAVLLVLTLGLLLSLTVNEFDLSFTGVMAVSIVMLGQASSVWHLPILAGLGIALAVGVLAGIANAALVIVVGVPSIVVTLGMGTLLAGVAHAINITVVSDIPEALFNATGARVLGLPLIFYYALGLTVAVWYMFSYTPLGRYMYFVGASHSVSRLAGLPVNAIRAGALIATSSFAAVAGIMLVGSLGSAGPDFASPYLLPSFAAAFLGSTTIVVGRFNAWGTFAALYFLTTGITGLELRGLSGWIENVFYGGSLVLAAALSQLSRSRSGALR